MSATARLLLAAAHSAFDDVAAVSKSDFDDLYRDVIVRKPFVVSLIAGALFERAIEKGKGGDDAGAIADYTAAIELPGVSAEQVAKALSNRGVGKAGGGDIAGAIADFTAAVELPGVPAEHVAKALINRGNGRGEGGDVAGAIADYTAVIQLPGAPPDTVAIARANLDQAKA